MPTLDRRLLVWDDDDGEEEENDLQMVPSWDSYDRSGPTFIVDDVLVPGTKNGLDGATGFGRPSSSTRKCN